MSEESEFEVEIEIAHSGPVVRVKSIPTRSEDLSGFDEAYLHARMLYNRIAILDERNALLLRIDALKAETDYLWASDGDNNVLGEVPEDAATRLALALLRRYPNPAPESTLAKETGVRQNTANLILRGKRKASAGFFEGSKDGYQITEAGVDWLETDVIPTLTNVDDNSS